MASIGKLKLNRRKANAMATHTEEKTVETGEPQAEGQVKVVANDLTEGLNDPEPEESVSFGRDVEMEYHGPDIDGDPTSDAPVSKVAAAMIVPPGMEEQVRMGDYDPRQFVLMHFDIFNQWVNDGVAYDEMERRLFVEKRGHRKTQKHIAAGRQELKRERLQHTRTARKLRKARASRDRYQRLTERLMSQIRWMRDYIAQMERDLQG